MLSRVGEALYWMSRYIERAENTARLLDVNFQLLLDLHAPDVDDAGRYWATLVRAAGDVGDFAERYAEFTPVHVTEYLVFDRENPTSITACIMRARENARGILESISSEMWEQVNRLYHFLHQATPLDVARDPYQFYREIKSGSHLFQGITDSTFSHGEGWDFVQVGKYLERADNTARLVDVKFHALRAHEGEIDIIQWMAVLKSCSALEAFRKVHLAQIDPDTILRFLVLDRAFPRSITFAVTAGEEALWRISGSSRRNYNNAADRMIGKLESDMTYTTSEDLRAEVLHGYLLDVETRLAQIGEQVHRLYFAHASLIFEEPSAHGIWNQAQMQQQQ